jgi:hypothetical protein
MCAASHQTGTIMLTKVPSEKIVDVAIAKLEALVVKKKVIRLRMKQPG